MWNWQQNNWPEFKYDIDPLAGFESQFMHQAGMMLGVKKHLTEDEQKSLIIISLGDEALKTSEIEGEYLNRDSLQSSIRRHFGINTDNRKISPAESGISEMMLDLYDTYHHPLTHKDLFRWHSLLTNGRMDLENIGEYRTCLEPMQIVSGRDYEPKIHFEAPPSSAVTLEMYRYIDWYNSSEKNYSTLTRAAIAHLYFESIHPFEDGNGRIGRALVIKALSQNLKQPTLIALSSVINKNKKHYYNALEQNNKNLEITEWLSYFAKTILQAQAHSLKLIEFLVKKGKFYNNYKELLNARQEKVINRIFAETTYDFEGGMSSRKYISITKTSKATATRDLQELVNIGAMVKTGILKGTRYYLT